MYIYLFNFCYINFERRFNDKQCIIFHIERESLLHKENLNFEQFQRNVELELEAIKLAKKNIEENLKETLKKRT